MFSFLFKPKVLNPIEIRKREIFTFLNELEYISNHVSFDQTEIKKYYQNELKKMNSEYRKNQK